MEENNTQHTSAQAPSSSGNDVEENKGMAVLSYIGILVLIPLLAKKDSKFAQFHAKQGLVIFIGEVIISVIGVIPFIGWLIWFVGWIFLVVISIMGIVNALKGQMKELPVVGGLSHKIMK